MVMSVQWTDLSTSFSSSLPVKTNALSLSSCEQSNVYSYRCNLRNQRIWPSEKVMWNRNRIKAKICLLTYEFYRVYANLASHWAKFRNRVKRQCIHFSAAVYHVCRILRLIRDWRFKCKLRSISIKLSIIYHPIILLLTCTIYSDTAL
jgi:hypothetical protein